MAKPEFSILVIGGASIDKHGVTVADETLELGKAADSILTGSVSGAK